MAAPDRTRSPLMHEYYEREWGRLIDDDTRFFEYLCLEIFQAGLSWETIIRKRAGMREALDGFDAASIAAYDDARIDDLCRDARVIRHRKKLEAIRGNARVFSDLTVERSFLEWLSENRCRGLEEWIALFRRTFSFMGPEIVREFLESGGVIEPHSHRWTGAFSKLDPDEQRLRAG